MASVTQIYTSTGATEAGARALAEGGAKFGRDDLLVSAVATPTPTAPGTNYSWPKTIYLYTVSGGGGTSILNRTIGYVGTLAAGLTLWYKLPGTYAQAAALTDNATTNDAAPAGYTALPAVASPASYDAATVAAADSTRNGALVQVALGVSNLYAGGADAAAAVATNIQIGYDEQ